MHYCQINFCAEHFVLIEATFDNVLFLARNFLAFRGQWNRNVALNNL
jgi:hypothetical protein